MTTIPSNPDVPNNGISALASNPASPFSDAQSSTNIDPTATLTSNPPASINDATSIVRSTSVSYTATTQIDPTSTSSLAEQVCPGCHHPRLSAAEGFGIGFGVGILLVSLFIAGVYIFSKGNPIKAAMRDVVDNARQRVSHPKDHDMATFGEWPGPKRTLTKSKRAGLTESTVPVLDELGAHETPVVNNLDCLPQPIGHDDLRLELNRVETPIKNFVDNFFHSKKVPYSDFQEDQLIALAGEANAGDTWTARLSDSNTRSTGLRCFIAQIVFRSMDPDYDPAWSLLPPGVVASYAQIMAGEEARNQRCKIEEDISHFIELTLGFYRSTSDMASGDCLSPSRTVSLIPNQHG